MTITKEFLRNMHKAAHRLLHAETDMSSNRRSGQPFGSRMDGGATPAGESFMKGALKGGLPDFVPDLLRQLGVKAGPGTHPTAQPSPAATLPGTFLSRSYANAAGQRTYKVYLPSGTSAATAQRDAALPVVVMLHGCTQEPDDFAAGTRMNAIAERERCIVVYPAQSSSANHSRCWNWFNPEDQRRDSGEPSLIAGITRAAIEEFGGDPRRVYIAGLSAGGAMAMIMGMTYPELYAAVGVHSGLPYGSAHDLQSAFAAMQGKVLASRTAGRGAKPAVRAIIFHGDHDKTVHPANAERLVAQTAAAAGGADPVVIEGQAKEGRTYTRVIHRDAAGRPVSEQWTVHGAGHAWSGGSPLGSYTDPAGPNAGEEMMRFFHLRQEDA